MTLQHRFLTDSSGGPLTMLRLTNERCRACSPALQGVLGVLSEGTDGRTETVHCMMCDFMLTRPRMPTITPRKMNDGRF